MTGVCFIHNKLGIQYGFISTKNVLVSRTGDIRLGTFLYNTLKLKLNPEKQILATVYYKIALTKEMMLKLLV